VPLFISGGLGLVSNGLGLVVLVLIFRIWSCLHHRYNSSLAGHIVAAPLQTTQLVTITVTANLFSEMSSIWSCWSFPRELGRWV